MPVTETRTIQESILIISLRIIGISSLFALIFVAAPESWMNEIHIWLGLGPLPDEPIVGYLTRSLSGFYALHGALLLIVSTDLPRYKPVITFLGIAFIGFGIALLIIDWAEGLPFFWTVWEGPFIAAFGLLVLLLSRQIHFRQEKPEKTEPQRR